MKLIEKEFTGRGEVKGFRFTQVKQNQQAYIYKVDSKGTIWYEVFERKVNAQYECESYPRSKSFGLWAWSTPKYEVAEEYFNEITNRVLNRK